MNICVIGCGRWGKNHVKNYHELGHLYSVCEKNPEIKAELRENYENIIIYDDFNEVLNDKNIDGIVITTPAETHFELAQKSLKAGFPTFVEKPVCLNLKDSEILTGLAESAGLPLMVGHILEYHPAVLKMKELAESGEIGEIKHIRCARINLGKIRNNENIWWSFAPHDLSIIFKFFNEEPYKVKASSFKPIQENIADTVYADLFFTGQRSAHIHVSWLEPEKLHQTVIIGEKGMLVFDDTKIRDKLKLIKYCYDDENILLNKEEERVIDLAPLPPLRQECIHFIECLREKKSPLTDGKSACRIIKVIGLVDKELASSSVLSG